MPPHNDVRYYLMNSDKTAMYAYTQRRRLGMVMNLPWLRPYLFSSGIEANKIAQKYRLRICVYVGKRYENSPDDNRIGP